MTCENTNVSYKYNDQGIRTEKTVNGVTTKYHLIGDRVTYETNGTDKIYYTYDSQGSLVSMNLNGTEYYYMKNGQGDIIGLFDDAGTVVVTYTYQSFGKLFWIQGSLAGPVGLKNPYRYRGYRYDTETRLYYLQSRYYNPEWGRFINADDTDILDIPDKLDQVQILESNLFAYCFNNPVNYEDPSGYFAFSAAAFAAEFGLGLSGAELTAALTTFILTVAPYLIIVITVIVAAAAVVYLAYVAEQNILQAKGGKQRIKDSGLIGWTDQEIADALDDPSTSAQEKQRLKKEQKARGERNKQKRQNNKKSK